MGRFLILVGYGQLALTLPFGQVGFRDQSPANVAPDVEEPELDTGPSRTSREERLRTLLRRRLKPSRGDPIVNVSCNFRGAGSPQQTIPLRAFWHARRHLHKIPCKRSQAVLQRYCLPHMISLFLH